MNVQEKNPKIVILTAELDNQSETNNDVRTDKLRRDLSKSHFTDGLYSGFEKVHGCFKGVKNNSYLVSLTTNGWEYELKRLKELAEYFGQEAILFSDEDRNTKLHFKDGVENIGKLMAVSQSEAIEKGDYTLKQFKNGGVVTSSQYYITKQVQ